VDAALLERIALEKTIRNAILHDNFVLHYQPTIQISNRRLVGLEALIRLPAGRRQPDPAAGLHSGRRGIAAYRQDRRLGAA
jgi:EAL domain-containing protein (putative c-di-GMP-specific phosphodiesterase class I)